MKMFICCFIILISINAYAQKEQVGITGGATFSNYSGNAKSGKYKAGITIGAIANIDIGKNFIVQPGINFVQKGARDKNNFLGIAANYSLTTNHIEVPINLMYSINGFFIGAGPSFSFGISGKWKYDIGGNKTEANVKFGNGDGDNMKGFDIAFNMILGGFLIKNSLFITANYNLGFRNLDPGTNPSSGTVNSRYFGIKIGYLLAEMKKK